MRGFSTIELMVALVIVTITIIAISTLSLQMPVALTRAEQEVGAIMQAQSVLEAAVASARNSYASVLPMASSTNGVFTSSLSVEPLEDESLSTILATVSWNDLFGSRVTKAMETRIVDATSTNTVCDPFVSGNWSRPLPVASYPLSSTGILKNPAQGSSYTVAGITTTPTTLIVAIGTTTKTTASTLFFFTVHGTSTPAVVANFDNAPSSRVGFDNVVSDGRYAFAGNAFGSGSSATCSDGFSCAQLHVFSLPTTGSVSRVAAYTLATTAPPFALSTGSTSAPVSTLTYYHGRVYLGLQKTLAGYEFNIIDVRDPTYPVWLSGFRIGRTVTSITVRGDYAYVSTDDPSRELVVLSVGSSTPVLVGSWDAPGSSTFGYGAASSVRGSSIRFGRSYTPNGPEFELLDSSDPTHIIEIQNSDGGTTKDPESVRDILTQDRLTFVLLSHRLELWDTSGSGKMSAYAPSYQLPITGEDVALTCRNNLIYVARNAADGTGYIDVLKGT